MRITSESMSIKSNRSCSYYFSFHSLYFFIEMNNLVVKPHGIKKYKYPNFRHSCGGRNPDTISFSCIKYGKGSVEAGNYTKEIDSRVHGKTLDSAIKPVLNLIGDAE